MALVTQHVVNICKTKVMRSTIAPEETPNSSNKTESFSYKGELMDHLNA